MLFISKNRIQYLSCRPPFRKISITNTSPDAESHEEQDGTNHFFSMTELWPNLCGDICRQKGRTTFVSLSLPENE